MATTEGLNGAGVRAPESEMTSSSPLRPVARWVRVISEGRSRLVMAWAVPQCPNIAAVVDSTSAY
jgi:hypothetical protein